MSDPKTTGNGVGHRWRPAHPWLSVSTVCSRCGVLRRADGLDGRCPKVVKVTARR